jgi:putative sigma-54 modulation protein
MQISITGHHVEITEAMRNAVENKFERLERHFDHVSNVHVILSV